ncbi:hypothetical protein BDQ12DRAFT_619788, partial [Crucibulum laeve]
LMAAIIWLVLLKPSQYIAFSSMLTRIQVFVLISNMPVVSASSPPMTFPDIPFYLFNDFIQNNFSSKISLSTALTVLFTLTQNTDFLSLHVRQQHPMLSHEHNFVLTAWMQNLFLALQEHFGDRFIILFKK